jgi:hypothetical protein
MWFYDDDLSRRFGGLRTGRRKEMMLSVNTRLVDRKKVDSYKVAIYIMVPLLFIAILFMSWMGIKAIGQNLFSKNNYFTITRILVNDGAFLSKERVLEYLQISEGMNIFSFDIQKVRTDFMARATHVKGMEIVRHLPGTLQIEISERTPVAVMGGRDYLVADKDGFLFNQRMKIESLPTIRGCSAEVLRPGKKLDSCAMAALRLLQVCEDSAVGLRISSVDVSPREYMVVCLTEGKPRVKFAWDKMVEDTEQSQKNLKVKVNALMNYLNDEQGKLKNILDMTLDDKTFAR